MTHCKTCEAPVRWVTMDATGKPSPLDAAPVPDGNITIIGDRGYVLSKAARARCTDPLYKNHFATCPQARAWRKP